MKTPAVAGVDSGWRPFRVAVMNYRHSEGAYFASRVAAATFPSVRVDAVTLVALVQAQSMAPTEPAVGTAF